MYISPVVSLQRSLDWFVTAVAINILLLRRKRVWLRLHRAVLRWQIFVASRLNGLIPSNLALKVMPQEIHSIALKKKMTTTY